LDYALLTDPEGNLLEADMANVLLYRNGKIIRPPVNSRRLLGVVEQVLCANVFPAMGIEVREAQIPAEEIEQACSIFLTNSIIDVLQVGEVGDIELVIDGDLARTLQERLQEAATS